MAASENIGVPRGLRMSSHKKTSDQYLPTLQQKSTDWTLRAGSRLRFVRPLDLCHQECVMACRGKSSSPFPLRKKKLSLDSLAMSPRQPAEVHQGSSHMMHHTAFVAMTVKRWRRRAKGRRQRAWTLEDQSKMAVSFEEDVDQPEKLSPLHRFRRMASMVRMLSAVCLKIRQYSRERNDQGFLLELRKVQQEVQPGTGCKDKGPRNGLNFDKESFSRERTLHFPLWARLICSKPSSERGMDECKRLCTFLRGMKSFAKFPTSVQLKLSQRMTYNHYDKHRILIRQGHLAHNFYFLLAGSLSVTIDTIDIKTGVKVTATVDTLHPPSSFGENAFISRQIRTASVVSNDNVEVLVLHKSDFYNFCWQYVMEENERKTNFLSTLPLFKNWDQQSIQTILADVKEVKFAAGKLIERDAEHCKYIYFVTEGSIDVIYSIARGSLRQLRHDGDLLVRRATASALTCFDQGRAQACILVEGGSLLPGNAWGVETLLEESNSCRFTSIYLQSCGCCVLQISRKRILELAPRGMLESYLVTYRPPMRLLADDELCRQYLQIFAWKEYKRNVIQEVMSMRQVEPLCHVASTTRGNSGWAKWPGFKIVELPKIQTRQTKRGTLCTQ